MTLPEEISQLEDQLALAKDPGSQASIINEILKKYGALSRKDGASYVERLRALAEDIDSNEYRAFGHLHTATLYKLQREHSASIKANEEAAAIFESIGHKQGLALSLNNIGVNYNLEGKMLMALDYFLKALRLHEEDGNAPGMATGYNNIGIIYSHQGNLEKALDYNKKALAIKEQIGDRSGMISSYINVGILYSNLGDSDKALAYQIKALEMMEEVGNKGLASFSMVNIGTIYSKRGDYPMALEYFLKAVKFSEEIGDKKALTAAYSNIGLVYVLQQDYTQALSYLTGALEMSEGGNFKDLTRDALSGLYKLYKARGDKASALDHYERYIATRDEIANAEVTKKLTDLQFTHDMEQKEKEVEIERIRNTELKEAKAKSDALLLNILPAEIAEELKKNGSSEARLYDNVTVLFTDFKNFTSMSERLSPKELVDELHACFSAFDHILEGYGIEKIKTVGDAYLAAAGIPVANENHAADMIRASLDIRDYMLQRREERGEATFEIRIGIHSGHVIAGIVGSKKFAYDIWGDTVNTAARMEQNSEPGRINISGDTHGLVKDLFPCSYRGKIDAKNKGLIDMYFVQ